MHILIFGLLLASFTVLPIRKRQLFLVEKQCPTLRPASSFTPFRLIKGSFWQRFILFEIFQLLDD